MPQGANFALAQLKNNMRKLASIQTIKFVRPIPNADAIDCVGVLGWECVCKKGEFQNDDKCVYFEIDSLLPELEVFEFLRKSCYRKDLNKFRLKSVKLRQQLSQGLALPLNLFPDLYHLEVGTDVTDLLNVEKYEPPIPAQIQGDAKKFVWPIAKTDEVRVQTDEGLALVSSLVGNPYYVSLKLDGTSCSFIIDPSDNEFHVCGRNYSYKNKPNHSFWIINERYQLEERLRSIGGNLALQGECVGPGIQQNKLGLSSIDYYIFNIVDTSNRKRLSLEDSLSVAKELKMNFVPILEKGDSFNYNMEQLLEKAKGKYREHFENAKQHQEREGIVIRSLCGSVSFKAINNEFLLQE
jgi:RNA ligase (TIGR02306 family)